MSLSSIISGIGGAITGFFIGGGPMGAVYGFAIGFGMGLAMDALAPDMPSPGQPQTSDLSLPSVEEGANIPDILGTTKLTGNIFQYWGNRTEEVTEDVGGKGGDSQTVTTGYKYYLSWAMGICLGPTDYLQAVYAGDDLVYEGPLARPASGGVEIVNLEGGDYETGEKSKSVTKSWPAKGGYISEGYSGSNYYYTFKVTHAGVYPTDEEDPSLDIGYNPFSIIDDSGGVNTFVSATLSVPGKVTQNVVSWSYNSSSGYTRIEVENPLYGPPLDPPNFSYASLRINYTYNYTIADNTYTMGPMSFYFGTDDQAINTKMQANIANTPAYRGLCYAFFDDCYIGNFNRMPSIRFIVSKFPVLTFNANNIIQTYDYNPSHAIWFILSNMFHASLPEEFLDATTFSSVADTLLSETRGISILFDRQQTAMAYIETILNHVGGMMRYSATGDLSGE